MRIPASRVLAVECEVGAVHNDVLILACLPVSAMPDLPQREPADHYLQSYCDFCLGAVWVSERGRSLLASQSFVKSCPRCAKHAAITEGGAEVNLWQHRTCN